MIIIAHRGNMFGPGSCDHDLNKVAQAMDKGYHVELDLWFLNNSYYLGHDGPEQLVDLADFDHPQIFFHLKNLFIPKLCFADAFAIHNDNFVLTLRGRLWCNYRVGYTANSIVCSPELVGQPEPLEGFLREHRQAFGVCTDYAYKVEEILDLSKC